LLALVGHALQLAVHCALLLFQTCYLFARLVDTRLQRRML
jgi:hypothetical protein